MHWIMSHTLDSWKYFSQHSYRQLSISSAIRCRFNQIHWSCKQQLLLAFTVRWSPLPFMGYSKQSATTGCRILEITWYLFREKYLIHWGWQILQGITVYGTWYVFVGMSARMRWWTIMACDIQQVRLSDLMVSSEYMNCWAVCQKPDRLLVFPQVTIFIYPCPPELCSEAPICII